MTVSEDGTTTYTYGDWSWAVDSEEETEDAEEATTTLTGTVVGITSYLNLRSGAGMDYGVIGKLSNGTEVEVIGEENGWYQVTADGQTGYVYSDYLEITEAAIEETEDNTELDSMDEMKDKKKEEAKPDPDADYTDEGDDEDDEILDTYDDSDYSDEDDSNFEDDEPV